MNRRNLNQLLGASAALATLTPLSCALANDVLQLGGSTAGQSLLKDWVAKFAPGAAYQGVGSGLGIQGVGAGTLDVGVTDQPLTPMALSQQGLVQVPLFGDGIAIIANISGANELKLNAEAMVEIYRGVVRDLGTSPAANANPGVRLSGIRPIAHGRRDASGSTRTFSAYMANASRTWAKEFSSDFTLNWPKSVVEVTGTSAMIAAVKAKPGAFGYAGLAEARSASLGMPMMINNSGAFVAPNGPALLAAISSATWDAAANSADLLRASSPQAWPMSFVVYALFKRTNPKSAAIRAALTRVQTDGQADITRLGFVPIPAAQRSAVMQRSLAS